MSSGKVPLNLCWENHPETTLGLWRSCKESPEHPTTLEMPEASGEATLMHNVAPNNLLALCPLRVRPEVRAQSLSDS